MSHVFLRRCTATIACTTLVLAPASAAPALAVEAAAEEKTISIMSFNDFHGALSEKYSGTQFADTVEDYRRGFEKTHGADTTLLTSAGDLIGGSASVSNVQQDNPTIDAMNALGLDSLAAGNHEYDKGLDDLTGRVIPRADFPVLSANFVDPTTKEPVLTSHKVFDVDGVRVAVIGASPNDLYSTTTGAGLQGNEVQDMVEAVNRVAADLEANDEADVIVASYHDGAAGSGELADEKAKRDIFRAAVEDTHPAVDVIFNGHTHQLYQYETDNSGARRHVMQAGQSGQHLAAVELTVDGAGEVTSATGKMLERSTQDPAEAAAESAVTAEVYAIEQKAVDVFRDKQSTVLADLDGSITTDYAKLLADGQSWRAGGTRKAETTLGNWVADALKHSAESTNPGVDLGVTNPGGLRSELLESQFTDGGAFTPKPDALAGKLTLGELLDMAPFGNTVVQFDIPGSSIKQALEQNWRDGVRQHNLGWSENLNWTYDDSKPQGEKVTGVWVDGEPLDEDRMYTVATVSFLGDSTWKDLGDPSKAPDGFTAFAEGRQNFVDLGLLDQQALSSYAEAQAAEDGAVNPSFSKQGVSVAGPASLGAGDPLAVSLDDLVIDSDGVPAAQQVSVAFEPADGSAPVELGSVDVPAGQESVDLSSLSAPQATGPGELVMTVTHTDGTVTTVRHALEVGAAADCTDANFSDNAEGSAYFSAVRWMQCSGLTTGYADGSFGKSDDTTRAQGASFLYRYLTDEGFTPAGQTFPDVPTSNTHFEPVEWTAAEQIVRGYVDGTFRPKHSVSRGEFASMLYRAAHPEYTAPATPDFPDVSAANPHYEAIQWAASEGLVTGYHDGTFAPGQDITRGEIAVMLHRFDAVNAGDAR